MPKKLKLNLNDLKVQSFITSLTEDEKNRFKGAGSVDGCDDTGTQCSAAGSCAASCAGTCVPICTNTGGGCTGLPVCCN